VEHPALAPARPWRSAALLAAAVAVVELVLLVVVGLAFLAKPLAGQAEEAAKAPAAEAKTSPAAAPAKPGEPVAKLSRRETSVLVLNGNGRAGAAGNAAGVVRGLHYLLAGTGNAPRTNFARSLVMYRPGLRGEALRLARDVRVKQVAPLDGMRASDLQGAHLALIVGGGPSD
jgi:hypothetical protein